MIPSNSLDMRHKVAFIPGDHDNSNIMVNTSNGSVSMTFHLVNNGIYSTPHKEIPHTNYVCGITMDYSGTIILEDSIALARRSFAISIFPLIYFRSDENKGFVSSSNSSIILFRNFHETKS
jgi:hypothetical protein